MKNYAQLLVIYVAHLLTLAFRVNPVYHVRRLGTGYKRTETRGVSLATFDDPIEALQYIQKVTQNHDNQESLYFILAEARFGFVPVQATQGDYGLLNERPVDQGGEATGIGPGVHPAETPAAEPGRVLADRSEGEELSHAEAGDGDRERN